MTHATNPARGIRTPTRMLTLSLALFLTLAGTSVARASWTTPTVTATASVSAGSLSVTQAGFGPAATSYTSTAGALTVTRPVTVANNGTVAAPYVLSFGAQAATALATASIVRVWAVGNTGLCTAAATATGPSTWNWTTIAPFAATLAPGASTVYCVRASISATQRFTLRGGTVTSTATLGAGVGSWTSGPTVATWTQTVADTLTPGTPTKTAGTDRSITLAWAPPADPVGVAGYQVFRNGVLIATVPTPAYTDTNLGANLSVGTSYSYTVTAIDAASPVDASSPSAAADLSTAGIDPAAWYKVKVAGTETCIDGENETTASGTAMIIWTCKSAGFDNQSWRFPTPAGASVVTGKYAQKLAWDTSVNSGTDGTRVGAPAQLRTIAAGAVNQGWTITAVGNGTFRFANGSGRCLDTGGIRTATNNVELQQAACGAAGLASQTFTLTNVG